MILAEVHFHVILEDSNRKSTISSEEKGSVHNFLPWKGLMDDPYTVIFSIRQNNWCYLVVYDDVEGYGVQI